MRQLSFRFDGLAIKTVKRFQDIQVRTLNRPSIVRRERVFGR